MAEHRADVIIVGGGMVGLALAAGLADTGYTVAVVEARQAPAWRREHTSNRVSAITHASRRLLERLGAWEAIAAARVSPFEAIHAWDAAGHPGVTFDAADRGEACLGHIVENTLVQDALRAAVGRRSNVSLYCPVTVDDLAIEPDRVGMRLGDGRRLRADLLVGADGARSMVREAAGIGADTRDYHQRGIVATVTTEIHHGAVARQRFLPTGPVALLPLADGRCSLVWSATEERADELEALDELAFSNALTDATEGVLGVVIAAEDRAAFPLRRLHANEYVAPRVALVGDAAHVIHPLAGQGVNLGFLDAAALVDVLAEGRQRHGDAGAYGALRRYARWRRADNALMQTAMDGFHWLFSNNDPVRAIVRNLGLGLTDRLVPAKTLFVDHAVGRRGDLPSLMR
ncbi:UbiH/UbiF/VisC/COQ6 family ubiquinone biosynthesis hydroxylase [Aquisalimonas sp. 2447]|uniref:UbiH/UbiF/VisC/COQ6 family ubiquinone biosynthesis hydroxylase n=1 Tax=Aquisalimonas sp. 2447 TaxID=2740807 RepID=UPI00143260E8|nr:UbiH/UbiF/VisC/COQ6 family ubiquinone biosynthesis hydroxylase [Aquisalimonas sp. 2447]QIT53992.1 UbiH/UbiF/VisC/COQ6 family ubiquinone biosynthesis hydroxylase [Aquisalimonas sp. 2447]